jgi:hypothetical protein
MAMMKHASIAATDKATIVNGRAYRWMCPSCMRWLHQIEHCDRTSFDCANLISAPVDGSMAEILTIIDRYLSDQWMCGPDQCAICPAGRGCLSSYSAPKIEGRP